MPCELFLPCFVHIYIYDGYCFLTLVVFVDTTAVLSAKHGRNLSGRPIVTIDYWSCNICLLYKGTAVAQWLRCCATNRKVAGSIPAGVTGIFH